MATISKTSTFEAPNIFSPNFLPFVRLGSACGLASGCGSRGSTPLHVAACDGHDSVVERLLEAKAAVDVQNKNGPGLGGGYWGGNLMRPWDSVVKCMKMLMVEVFCQRLFSVFVERISQKTLVFFLAFTFSAPLLLQCTDKTCYRRF